MPDSGTVNMGRRSGRRLIDRRGMQWWSSG